MMKMVFKDPWKLTLVIFLLSRLFLHFSSIVNNKQSLVYWFFLKSVKDIDNLLPCYVFVDFLIHQSFKNLLHMWKNTHRFASLRKFSLFLKIEKIWLLLTLQERSHVERMWWWCWLTQKDKYQYFPWRF